MTAWERAEVLVSGLVLVVIGALAGNRVAVVAFAAPVEACAAGESCGCTPENPPCHMPCSGCCVPKCPCEEPDPSRARR